MITFDADKVGFIFVSYKTTGLNIVQSADLRVDFGVSNSGEREDFRAVRAGIRLEVAVKVG